MKRFILLPILCLFVLSVCAGTSWAAPFLTCECTTPADKVTAFSLQFGVQPAIDIPAVECVPAVTDGKRILYDLGTLPVGAFTVRAKAKSLWGESGYTPFLSDTKQLPGLPLLLKITP